MLAPVDSVLENSETSSQENDTEHSLTNNVVGERSFGAGTYKAKYYLKKIKDMCACFEKVASKAL